MQDIQYLQADVHELDDIRPLWEQLNALHISCSPHFASRFERYRFDDRKKELQRLAHAGELLLLLARKTGQGQCVGYCVSSIHGRRGEIESIFVNESYRHQGVGHALMVRSLEWLNEREVNDIMVGVVAGNESAWNFYARYGFMPHCTSLLRKMDAK